MSMVVAIGPSSFADSDPEPLRLLEAAGVTVKPNPFKRRLTEAEIIEHLQGVDGLIAGLEPLNARVLESSAPRLKAIARVGIGVSNVDFDAAAAKGVKVSSTPEPPAAAVAELTMAALLAITRRLLPINAAMHEQKWPKEISFSLDGATALVIGYGRIGAKMANLLRAFGTRVLVHDPALDGVHLPEGLTCCELEEGLAQADIVSLHASGDRVILDTEQFAVMKRGAILLNGARGELVSQSALVVALENATVSGGWFDAFWEEPYSGVLCQYPQMLLTPHVGTYTTRCRLVMETQAVRNLLRDLELPYTESPA
ncbi:MAG: hypothetical protein RLZZ303_2495 [Candidatus Hydrogenedentota bacterium]